MKYIDGKLEASATDYDLKEVRDGSANRYFFTRLHDLMGLCNIRQVAAEIIKDGESKEHKIVVEILDMGIVAGRNAQKTGHAIGSDVYEGLIQKAIELVGSHE